MKLTFAIVLTIASDEAFLVLVLPQVALTHPVTKVSDLKWLDD